MVCGACTRQTGRACALCKGKDGVVSAGLRAAVWHVRCGPIIALPCDWSSESVSRKTSLAESEADQHPSTGTRARRSTACTHAARCPAAATLHAHARTPLHALTRAALQPPPAITRQLPRGRLPRRQLKRRSSARGLVDPTWRQQPARQAPAHNSQSQFRQARATHGAERAAPGHAGLACATCVATTSGRDVQPLRTDLLDELAHAASRSCHLGSARKGCGQALRQPHVQLVHAEQRLELAQLRLRGSGHGA